LPIDPDLPPDQPLEPGSGPPKFSARIAASEAALGGGAPASAAPGGKSSFIAAARRAAQTALQQAPSAPAQGEAEQGEEGEGSSLRGKLMKRMKSLFVAASIIAIVAGGAQILGKKFDLGGPGTKTAKTGKVEVKETEKVARATGGAPLSLSPDQPAPTASAAPPPPVPNALSSAPFNMGPGPANSLFNPPDLSASAGGAQTDVTGSIPRSVSQPTPARQPALPEGEHEGEQLPVAIGGPKLRSAALAGDGAAAYEVAVRFADGRGVPANLPEAARWFERAASRGLAPAEFRFASMLEKGQGVKKDLAAARRLYFAAAAKGNAKAMHNLAVLYAEGVDGKPDYPTAVKWFRKAARHGIADSQYNLGVLAARGLGTEKSFAESYTWFALAAAKGDPESAKKRDQVATQLDPELLAQAQQAIKAFVPEPQPEAATAVPKPHGGWDAAAGGSPSPKTKAKPQPQPHSPLSLGSFTVGKR
jgi:localization factor PodJL